MELQSLTDNFAIPDILSFDTNEAGLVRARITTPACSAELYLQGAHLTHWQPAGQEPVLFISERSSFAPGKAIRGGVPVIFPWFGARTEAVTGGRTDGPSHGFARTEPWQLAFAALSGPSASEQDLHLTFTLAPTQQSRALGFDNFRLAYQLILGRTLTLRLTVANEAAEPLRFEEALHSYFAVADAQQVRITGLAGTEYLDKTDSFRRKRQTEAVLTLSGETDRPYLNTTADIALEDPGLGRRISVAKQGSQTTVVWNPWTALSTKLPDMADEGWRRMTCIETANAADNIITLASQTAHTMEARISVEATDAT
jgi:glucose-6-phosphate 1-epimerase